MSFENPSQTVAATHAGPVGASPAEPALARVLRVGRRSLESNRAAYHSKMALRWIVAGLLLVIAVIFMFNSAGSRSPALAGGANATAREKWEYMMINRVHDARGFSYAFCSPDDCNT